MLVFVFFFGKKNSIQANVKCVRVPELVCEPIYGREYYVS